MRLSFDLNDTLVVYDPSVPTEQVVPWRWRWRYREPLRRGTQAVLHALRAQAHDLWIYTTSDRPAGYVRGWFRSIGVPVTVVNRERHERIVDRAGPSKLPRAFGIDLHFDHSWGVAEEG